MSPNGCQDPEQMLRVLGEKATQRKLRLLAAAFCRRLWRWLPDDPSRIAIEVAERFADGEATVTDLGQAALRLNPYYAGRWDQRAVRECAERWLTVRSAVEIAEAVSIYLRQTVFDPTVEWKTVMLIREIFGDDGSPRPLRPEWRSPLVLDFARSIYDTRDRARLPILADALEDAGCDDADLLDHLRGPGPHAHGCWALDAVLGL